MMAHDNQYKDATEGRVVERVGRPEKGELYWNRYTHRVEQADCDMEGKFLIIKREGS